jgi:hypothetical protein
MIHARRDVGTERYVVDIGHDVSGEPRLSGVAPFHRGSVVTGDKLTICTQQMDKHDIVIAWRLQRFPV